MLLYIGPALRKTDNSSDHRKTTDRTSTVKNRPAEMNIHNSRFLEALEAYEDILKILSSLVSNGISSKYFGLPNVEI